jgi:hypothetical protein
MWKLEAYAVALVASCALGGSGAPGAVLAQQRGQVRDCMSIAQILTILPCPPRAPSPPVACFFRSGGFVGPSFCEPIGVRRNSLGAWQDAVGSIWLFNGARVRVCAGSDLSGECHDYTDSVTRLTPQDHVMSIVVY